MFLVALISWFFESQERKLIVEKPDAEIMLTSASSVPLPDPPLVDHKKFVASDVNVSTSADVVDNRPHTRTEGASNKKNVVQEGIADESVSRMLFAIEQGKGPSIEIGWPQQYSAREALFLMLHDCYGMRVGRLEGGRLRAVEPMDRQQRMSAYLRVGSGAVISVEQQLLKKINGKGIPVRVFSRNFDSSLLAGFSQVYGSNLLGAKTVYGRYVVEGKALIVSDVLINGVQHESFQVDKRLNSCR